MFMQYKNVCVFCGSATGYNPVYSEKAISLADNLAKRGCSLVYGAGSQGLMGIFASRMKSNGAYVIGITPKRFERINEEHPIDIDEYHVVDDMHQRKSMMYSLSDAFIIFPGGIGTLDEMAEIMTWRQLGLHGKPVVIYNVNGYFNDFISFIKDMEDEGFYKFKDYYFVAETEAQIFHYLDTFVRHRAKYEIA